jgi:YidC/Oxa1 family membrane protein insertase
MEIWDTWTALITSGIGYVSAHFGVSEAFAIIIFTFFARILLLPISLKSAYTMYKNRLAMERVKPEIERLRAVYSENPGELAKRTMRVYKKNGIKMVDRTTILNIGSQSVLGLGMFHALNKMIFNSKFLWITNIGKPDVILAFIVGVLTFLSMQMMPVTAEYQSQLILIIPAMISMFVLVSFPSALGFYWATSNIVTMVQTLVLRMIILKEDCYPRRD